MTKKEKICHPVENCECFFAHHIVCKQNLYVHFFFVAMSYLAVERVLVQVLEQVECIVQGRGARWEMPFRIEC
ncbi:hypothetical protein T12_8797 [Trichinella patagoniensis]|uniref:Uncharacterized protein n=1 Tax=Trichinella patagoniensis TaxID=990121 RepID=A0A0V0ZYD6_9BILA|nr:hypothetical protein T12_8797 [Trichinella patagoniensis]